MSISGKIMVEVSVSLHQVRDGRATSRANIETGWKIEGWDELFDLRMSEERRVGAWKQAWRGCTDRRVVEKVSNSRARGGMDEWNRMDLSLPQVAETNHPHMHDVVGEFLL
jgi:hypothetical protein